MLAKQGYSHTAHTDGHIHMQIAACRVGGSPARYKGLQVPDRLVVHALLGCIMPGVVPPLARGVQVRVRSHAVEVVPTGRRAPQRRAARGRMSMSQWRLRSWWVLRLRGDRACRWRPLHVALGLHGARFSAHSAPTCPTHVRIPSCGAVHAVPAARSGYSDLSGTDGATDRPRIGRHRLTRAPTPGFKRYSRWRSVVSCLLSCVESSVCLSFFLSRFLRACACCRSVSCPSPGRKGGALGGKREVPGYLIP